MPKTVPTTYLPLSANRVSGAVNPLPLGATYSVPGAAASGANFSLLYHTMMALVRAVVVLALPGECIRKKHSHPHTHTRTRSFWFWVEFSPALRKVLACFATWWEKLAPPQAWPQFSPLRWVIPFHGSEHTHTLTHTRGCAEKTLFCREKKKNQHTER